MTHTAKHTPHWVTRQGFKCTDIVDSVTGEEIGYMKDHDHAVKAAAAPAMYEALKAMLEHEGERVCSGIGTEHDSEALEAAKQAARAALAQAEGVGHE